MSDGCGTQRVKATARSNVKLKEQCSYVAGPHTVIGVGDPGVGREESQLFLLEFRLSGERNRRVRSPGGAGFLIVPRKYFTPTDLLLDFTCDYGPTERSANGE